MINTTTLKLKKQNKTANIENLMHTLKNVTWFGELSCILRYIMSSEAFTIIKANMKKFNLTSCFRKLTYL